MNPLTRISIFFSVVLYFNISPVGSAYQCCGFDLMDADGVVLVEAFRVLPAGRYQAIKFRSCSNQLIAIQLWNCDSNNLTCRFKWQTVAQASSVDQSSNFNPIVIGINDRLGIFTTANSSSQLAIPFGQDILANLFRSTSQFSDALGFSTDSQITLNMLSMSRSFAMSIVFCENKDCVGLPNNSLASPTIVRDNVNQPALGQCCKSQLGCNPNSLNDQIASNTLVILELQHQIDILNQIILSITNQVAPVTGICPAGFTSGPYGLGKCYRSFYAPVNFAVAAFYCRDNFVANLLAIGSQMEEDFLRTFIANQGGYGNFWTSGMYRFSDSNWYWYNKISDSLQYQAYSSWQNKVAPKPTTIDYVCSNLVVNKVDNNLTDYWVMANCNDINFFICEMPKTCF